MTVKELMKKISNCNPKAELKIIQEEELECIPELWDDKKHKVGNKATELYSEDCHSHEIYLLAVSV